MIMVRKDSFKYIKKRLDKARRGPKAPIFKPCQPLKCIFIIYFAFYFATWRGHRLPILQPGSANAPILQHVGSRVNRENFLNR